MPEPSTSPRCDQSVQCDRPAGHAGQHEAYNLDLAWGPKEPPLVASSTSLRYGKGWLRLTSSTSVELDAEPPVGPYFVGRHVLNWRWKWYEGGQLWGPSSRYRWLCRYRHWRGDRRGF